MAKPRISKHAARDGFLRYSLLWLLAAATCTTTVSSSCFSALRLGRCRSARCGRGGLAAVGSRGEASSDGRSRATASTPSAKQLMESLGRELWAAAEELLEASALLLGTSLDSSMSKSPRALTNCALALRNAADTILDGDWESAMGELETAAVSCEGYLPSDNFQGLIDLFGYEVPVPKCEWVSASASLGQLSGSLAQASRWVVDKSRDVLVGSTSTQEASDGMQRASDILRRAMRLFVAGDFYTPEDPRRSRGERGEPGRAAWGQVPPSWGSAAGGRSDLEMPAPGSPAAKLLADIRTELEQTSSGDAAAWRAKLRQLVRRLHPDQNPGKEAEVLPAFQLVQSLREEEAS
ncbi:unnamed protein product [Polarella glacialis]|uniref:J domain-containing protein n=1 Tax=Polarella glacialis TaxID=89957 RepID=A0A813GFU4_POLGL|nr:unnamed protein product [Polarella glacialis]CAE8651697.1 unnamed protein product [Polarella glacialis]